MKKSQKQYIMVTYEFGEPVFIAPLNGQLSGANVTPSKTKAELWDEKDTASPHKLDYYKVLTGYKNLQFEEAKNPLLNKQELANMFNVPAERISEQYKVNAAQMRKMAEKARQTGRKVNGATAAELEEKAKWFEELAAK